MIRKTIIVVLTVLAVGTLLLWAVALPWTLVYQNQGNDTGIHRGVLFAYWGMPWTVKGWYFSRASTAGLTHVSIWWPMITQTGGFSSRLSGVFVPLFWVALLTGIYPTIACIRGPLRRWRRRRKGLCLNCGYDLTGNESGVCPECGEAV
ncbi:MAG: hypothetical protein JSU63_19400 [Phycisphaerales bacterium]|nr:MAG: hypothetical protein JSU63_19400 [Phycisphaerales bacterium]